MLDDFCVYYYFLVADVNFVVKKVELIHVASLWNKDLQLCVLS